MPILDNLLVSLGFKVNTDPLKHAGEALEGINHKLEILAGIEIAKGLYELVEHFSHFGDDLEMAAFQAGVTAEQFQKLVYAGSQFNVSQEAIQGGLAKMSRLLANARDGSKKAVETFTNLGISKEQVAGFQNAEDAFYAVQDALAAIPDSFRRVNETTKIFGRGAVALTKFASVGSKATRKLGQEAEHMGAIVSNEGVSGLAEFEDRMQAFGLTVRGFFGNLAASMAPALKELVRGVQEVIGANSKLAGQNFDVWSERIAYALGFATETFRLLASRVHDFIATHPKLIAFAGKTAALFISMSIAGGLLRGALLPLKVAFTVISAAVGLFGGTITLVIVGVLGLIAAFVSLYQMAHGRSFKDTTLGSGLVWLKNYAVDATKAFQELTGATDKTDFSFGSAGTPSALVSPISNEALAEKAGFFDQAFNGIAAASDGMGTLRASAIRRQDGVPSLLARPGVEQTVNVTAPITINVSGKADAEAIRSNMESAAQDVFQRAARRVQQDTAPAARR